jgi:Fe-Mn family superoxide dismutase
MHEQRLTKSGRPRLHVLHAARASCYRTGRLRANRNSGERDMSNLSRREILGSAALVGGWLALGSEPLFGQQGGATTAPGEGAYRLPPLPYDYADLEPHIDAATMKLHHDIHHKGYVDGANAAIADLARIRQTGGDEVKKVRAATDALSFNAAGHVLHTIFWENMKKAGGGDPAATSEIGKLIVRDFGSLDAFRGHFSAAAAQVQGSGWGMLAYEPLAEKHNNTGVAGSVPLLCLDVWEHAYYLNYKNKRTDYIKAWWNVVNWEHVDQRLAYARKLG